MHTLVLVSIAALCASFASAFTISLERYAKQCFYEDLKQGDRFGVDYEVVAGDGLRIDFVIRNPQMRDIHAANDQSSGSYNIIAEQNGKYQYCFSNIVGSQAPKKVTFYIRGVGAFDLLPKEKDVGE